MGEVAKVFGREIKQKNQNLMLGARVAEQTLIGKVLVWVRNY